MANGILVPGYFSPQAVSGYITESRWVKGTYVVLPTFDDRALIPQGALVEGTKIYVAAENREYRYIDNNWQPLPVGFFDAPIDGKMYARQDGTWVEVQVDFSQIDQQIADLQAQVDQKADATSFEAAVSQINSQLNTKADTSDIPTEVSQLTNDAGYITESVEYLPHFYTKTDIDAANTANLVWSDAEPVTQSIGSIHAGDVLAGMTLMQILQRVFYDVEVPELTNPSFSVNINAAAGIAGSSIEVSGVATFNRGSIEPAYGTSGFRAGLPTEYIINGNQFISSEVELPFTISIDNVPLGVSEYSASVNFSAGEQPLDSKGGNFSSPYPAGTLNSTFSVTGFVAAFSGNSGSITQDEMAAEPITDSSSESKDLTGMFEDLDGSGYVEGSGYQVQTDSFTSAEDAPVISIPAVFTVVGIKTFDGIANTWSWYYGDNAEESVAANTFIKSLVPVERQIDGQNIQYYDYTYNYELYGSMGENQFRFYVE